MVLLNRRKYMGVRRSPQGAPLDISDAVITVADSVQYTGSPRTPSVTVVYDGVTLVANTDYFVAYNDNTNVGAATVVVTGTGSFTGMVVKTFQIVASSSGNWLFGINDFPETIEFSHFGNSTHGNYHQICPSHDETKLLVGTGTTYAVRIGTWSNFDPSTYSETAISPDGIRAGSTLYTPDGIHYLTQNYSTHSVFMYEGTDAYDVSTIPGQYSNYKYVSNSENTQGCSISRDGLHLICMIGSTLTSFDLSTPFDLSTASNKKEHFIGSIDNIFMNQNNGKQILCVSGNRSGTSNVFLITLGSSWDASSVESVDSALPNIKVGSETYTSAGFFRGVAVNNAGSKVVLIGSAANMTSSHRPDASKVYAAMIDFS